MYPNTICTGSKWILELFSKIFLITNERHYGPFSIQISELLEDVHPHHSNIIDLLNRDEV